MNVSKINLWVIGIVCVFTGSFLSYYESYRNNQIIGVGSDLLIFVGWMVLFMQATKNTSIADKKVPFNEDKVKWLQQSTINFFAYGSVIALLIGNIYYISEIADNRRHDILYNQPTNTTVAEVINIDKHTSRNSTSYYAVFQYTVNNQIVEHPRHENQGDYFAGEKYEIRYSVEYPEMFLIIKKLPPVEESN